MIDKSSNMIKEKVVLAEIYKQDGEIGIALPNMLDVQSYELYGFLKCYLKKLEKQLIDSIEGE